MRGSTRSASWAPRRVGNVQPSGFKLSRKAHTGPMERITARGGLGFQNSDSQAPSPPQIL